MLFHNRKHEFYALFGKPANLTFSRYFEKNNLRQKLLIVI